MKELGNTKIEVSRLCFGTLTLGPLQAGLDIERGADVLAYAISRGVNFFDTAQLYETYPYIRHAMRKTCKYDLVIASKTYAHTKELAGKAVEQARLELDRDYIDIFMLHEQESVHTLNGHREALEYLLECKSKGVIRAVGASMHHIAAVYAFQGLDIIHPLINVKGLGIVDGSRDEMAEAIKSARNAGTGVYSMKALGGGNLFKQAEACLQYVAGLDFIDSIAIGMQNMEEVDANIGFFNAGAFSDQARLALSKRYRRLHIDSWCAGCGDCVKKCSQKALYIQNGVARCDSEKCLLCGYCAAVCSMWAIKVI